MLCPPLPRSPPCQPGPQPAAGTHGLHRGDGLTPPSHPTCHPPNPSSVSMGPESQSRLYQTPSAPQSLPTCSGHGAMSSGLRAEPGLHALAVSCPGSPPGLPPAQGAVSERGHMDDANHLHVRDVGGHGSVVRRGAWARRQGLNLDANTCWLCGFDAVASPLCPSVSSCEQWRQGQQLTHGCRGPTVPGCASVHLVLGPFLAHSKGRRSDSSRCNCSSDS